MSDAFQSATSNPSKYRGLLKKKTFRGPKSLFLNQALESFKILQGASATPAEVAINYPDS